MDEADREELYDKKIAPKLLELGRLCEANGMAFIATCWWSPTDGGTTATCPEGNHPEWVLANAAHKCKGNIDLLVMAVARDVPDCGSSAVLRILKGPA